MLASSISHDPPTPAGPGEENPFVSFCQIPLDASPFRQQIAEIKLCSAMALFGRLPVPFGGFSMILWHTLSFRVTKTQPVLRSRVTRVSFSDNFAQSAQRN